MRYKQVDMADKRQNPGRCATTIMDEWDMMTAPHPHARHSEFPPPSGVLDKSGLQGFEE
jgi:hypothetical protein